MCAKAQVHHPTHPCGPRISEGRHSLQKPAPSCGSPLCLQVLLVYLLKIVHTGHLFSIPTGVKWQLLIASCLNSLTVS